MVTGVLTAPDQRHGGTSSNKMILNLRGAQIGGEQETGQETGFNNPLTVHVSVFLPLNRVYKASMGGHHGTNFSRALMD